MWGTLRTLPMWKPLGVRNFRLLWMGEGVSVFGDQFYFVALPWLTLQLTRSPAVLATVLMATAIPRGALILFGGAITDKVQPRLLMLGSNAVRTLLTAVLAGLVISGDMRLWELYVLAVWFGAVDAIFYPAFDTMAPTILDEDRLAGGNALLQGSTQLSSLAGPALAGLTIAAFAGRSGVGIAFGVDAATFAFATVLLAMMRIARNDSESGAMTSRALNAHSSGIFREVKAGLAYAWRDPILRPLLGIVAAASIAVNSPLAVGLPSLAFSRFSGGAAAFGLMFTAFGLGSLAGTIAAGGVHSPRFRGPILIGLVLGFGLGIIAIALVPSFPIICALLGVLGVGQGYVGVLLVTWIQIRTDSNILGRVMSILAFGQFGVAPLALVAAGFLAQRSVTLLFVTAGLVMGAAALGSLASRPLRTFD